MKTILKTALALTLLNTIVAAQEAPQLIKTVFGSVKNMNAIENWKDGQSLTLSLVGGDREFGVDQLSCQDGDKKTLIQALKEVRGTATDRTPLYQRILDKISDFKAIEEEQQYEISEEVYTILVAAFLNEGKWNITQVAGDTPDARIINRYHNTFDGKRIGPEITQLMPVLAVACAYQNDINTEFENLPSYMISEIEKANVTIQDKKLTNK